MTALQSVQVQCGLEDSHLCIFPSDGISRIRFTGQSYKAHSQPDASGPPKTYLRAIYTYYRKFSRFVKKRESINYRLR